MKKYLCVRIGYYKIVGVILLTNNLRIAFLAIISYLYQHLSL